MNDKKVKKCENCGKESLSLLLIKGHPFCIIIAAIISMTFAPRIHKINRIVYYAYLIIIKVVPIDVTLITYRQHSQYRKYIKQTELQKVVKEYDPYRLGSRDIELVPLDPVLLHKVFINNMREQSGATR